MILRAMALKLQSKITGSSTTFDTYVKLLSQLPATQHYDAYPLLRMSA
jgi:hypothetical protein